MSLEKKIAKLYVQAKVERITYTHGPLKEVRKTKQTTGGSTGKPRGIWYACGSDWKSFVQTEAEGSPTLPYNHKFKLNLNLSRMCILSNGYEMLEFYAKYRNFDGGGINWILVAKDYDGIEICPHQPKKAKSYSWYRYWDIASGCVWNNRAINSVEEVEYDLW